MRLASRILKSADLSAAADFVQQQPLERERYGSSLARLPSLWKALLLSGSLTAVGVEDLDERRGPLCGLMIRVFVTDEFVKECKETDFWLGPELAHRANGTSSPILSPKEIGIANAGDGVNVAMWVCHVDYSSPNTDDGKQASRVSMEAVALHHRGFNIKEVIVGSLDVPNATVALTAGGYFWDEHAQRYERHSDVSDDALRRRVERRHLLGLSRDLALAHWGNWISTMFAWSAPTAGFSPGQQRLMLAALDGRTDEELATELAVSPWTVKNTWRSIFARAGRRLPGVLPNGRPSTELDSAAHTRRGKEKRARLLAYVRDHPEELRPFSQVRVPRGHGSQIRDRTGMA